MKPWLLAILRNACNAEFARRGRQEVPTDSAQDDSAAEEMPMWQEPSPEEMMLRQQDSCSPPSGRARVARQIVISLPSYWFKDCAEVKAAA
jgi:hypothetical protein